MPVPSVDIIITSYNYGVFLGEAIASALGQTHKPSQVIVVDDGSTDNSVAVARAYPVKVVTQENQGLCAARNSGAAQSRSEYLMFLDADDVLESTYIERCLKALMNAPDHVAYAYTQMRLFGAETGIFESRPFDRSTLLHGNFINAAALIRRSAFDRAGEFDQRWRLPHEDHELWLRMLSLGYEGILVPEPLLRYRRHVRSMNTLSAGELEEISRMLKRKHLRLYLVDWTLHPVKSFVRAWHARRRSARR